MNLKSCGKRSGCQSRVRFREVKREIRVIGVSYSPPKHLGGKIGTLVGVIYRGSRLLNGVISSRVKVNGRDVTKRLATMIRSSPHYEQLRVIVLGDTIVGETNVINIEDLFRATELPVIVVREKKLDFRALSTVIPRTMLERLREAGKTYSCIIKGRRIYLQAEGVSARDAKKIIEVTSLYEHTPEALRVARIIGERLS